MNETVVENWTTTIVNCCRNFNNSLKKYFVIGMFVWVILNIIDYILTFMFVNALGIQYEFNPIARWSFNNWGFAGLFLFPKMIVTILFVFALSYLHYKKKHDAPSISLLICNSALCFVVYHNMGIVQYLY